MKVLRIDRTGVTEVKGDEDDILSPNIVWRAHPLGDSHDIWYDDEGLFAPELIVADIGLLQRVPLPAYVFGADGECSTDPAMSADEPSSMFGEIRRVR